MQLSNKIITASAPGKIILSGEHAVVYGCPALAMSIKRFCHITLQAISQATISFHLLGYNWQRFFTKQELLKLQTQLENQYQEFLQGKIPRVKILKESYLLAVYATVFFARRMLIDYFESIFDGLDITVSTTIPIGCGMGSSAALIVALGCALQEYGGQSVVPEVFLTWCKKIEDLQHGHSSGVDLYLAYHGGAVLFDIKGNIEKRNLPRIPLQIINTGAAQSSTGECVMHAEQFFKSQNMLDDFSSITLAMDKALQNNDCANAQECLRENHKLLNYIGVVPTKVCAFVAEVEQRGMAAKVSGSGAVRGDEAGVVLVIGDEIIDDLLVKYGYEKIEN